MFFRKAPSAVSWIAVFLGNPGIKYAGTRHNVGFMTGDICEKKYGVKIKKIKFDALTDIGTIGTSKVLFMKPQTFMNLSGKAVKKAMDFYKVPLDHILVVSDDISMPVGKIRIRRSGSSGGHNGLKNISLLCGGVGFPRIKVGVGAPGGHEFEEVADWVLSTFKNQDAEEIGKATVIAADALGDIIENGIDHAMCKFN